MNFKMKTIGYLLMLITCVAHPLKAQQDANNTFKGYSAFDLLQIEFCNLHIDSQVNRFSRALKLWFGKESDSDFNVYKKLGSLTQLHQEYFELFTTQLSRNIENLTANQIADQLRTLDDTRSDILSLISKTSNAEYWLNDSLYNLEVELASLELNFIALNQDCMDYGYHLELLLSELEKWKKETNTIRSYISKAGNNRNRISNIALSKLKLKYKLALQQKNNTEIAQLISQIEDASKIDRLTGKLESLKDKTMRFSNRYYSTLTYFDTIRTSASLLSEINSLEIEIAEQNISSKFESITGSIVMDLKNIKESINKLHKKALEKGWQFYKDEQVKSLELKISQSQPSISCQIKLKQTLEILRNTQNANQFVDVETFYYESIKLCNESKALNKTGGL